MLESEREAEALTAFLETPRGKMLPTSGHLWILRAVDGPYFQRLSSVLNPWVRQSDRRLASPFIQRSLDPLYVPCDPLALAIVFATKHREEVLHHLALAVEQLEEGGVLLVTVANDLGSGSLEKRVRELLGHVEPFSKHKCRVLYAIKKAETLNVKLLEQWKAQGAHQQVGTERLWSCPGIFSWRGPDEGSRFLEAFVLQGLKGHGADFGAGNGYLTRSILARNPLIQAMELLEVERKALDAAERNLQGISENPARLGYHWVDITQGTGLSGLDFIVMNPPFHAERGSVPALGRAFIHEAMKALRSGGKLFMVANRQLPYEAELTETRGVLVRRQEAGGFKLLEVEKR
jgi:16S rRNA (guanine1207-N2)-methyltransferase